MLLVLCLITLLAAPISAEGSATAGIEQLTDLAGKNIAVQTGTNFDELLNEKDYLKGNIILSYYNSPTDMIEAVKSGKAAAAPFDKPAAQIFCNQNPERMILPEQMDVTNYGIGFRKGSPFAAPFNQALAQLRKDGILKELEAKWTGEDARHRVPDLKVFEQHIESPDTVLLLGLAVAMLSGCAAAEKPAAAVAPVTETTAPTEAAAAFSDEVVYGTIYTSDENSMHAEAMAIQDGKIVYIGDKAGAESYIGTNTAVTDYKDSFIILKHTKHWI